MTIRMTGLLLGLVVATPISFAAQTGELEALTFEARPGTLFVAVREAGEALGLPVHHEDGTTWLANREIPADAPVLPDGTRLLSLRALGDYGAQVRWNAEERVAEVVRDDVTLRVRPGEKRVVIDKSCQELRAVQGSRVVLKTPVSTGRLGHRTPNGTFAAGPYKARMHYSSLYDDAPMPYSVQIDGDIFVHGYSSVPNVPASHGCIRMPLDGAARFFYEWVEVGTPVEIVGTWRD
ncbi:MAG: hypothetical protein EOP06_06305 [Proteobacteria bacterium]|nr:MAG: hypothetical protein EOP06_06305 [Pseudomonadota bacterium]